MRILIATLCYSGVSPETDRALRYAEKVLQDEGHEVAREWFPGDCILLRARSSSIQLALEYKFEDGKPFDYLIWIDADVIVGPYDLLRLLNHRKDIVAAPYRKKCDQPIYAIQPLPGKYVEPDENGLAPVYGCGTGCMVLSNRVLQDIYDNSHKYTDQYGRTNIFALRYGFPENDFVSADFQLCRDLINRGWTVYLDTMVTPSHRGVKIYEGDFRQYLAQQNATVLSEQIVSEEFYGLDFVISGVDQELLNQLADFLNELDIPTGKQSVLNLSGSSSTDVFGEASVYAYPFLKESCFNIYLAVNPFMYLNKAISVPPRSNTAFEREFFATFATTLQYDLDSLSLSQLQDESLPFVLKYAAQRWATIHKTLVSNCNISFSSDSFKLSFDSILEGNMNPLQSLLLLLGYERNESDVQQAMTKCFSYSEIPNKYDLTYSDLDEETQQILSPLL